MLVVEFVSALSDPTDNKVVRVVLRYCRGGFVFARIWTMTISTRLAM